MPNAALSAAVTRVGRAAARLAHPDPAETDGRLLGRFVQTRDEAASRELVRRLGPMALGVCRRVAGDHHLAEDAFQAAFLVLARRAADVVPREAVRGWPHGVAVRTAQKARAMSARGRARQLPVPAVPDRPAAEPDAADPDALRVLDEEVGPLPDHLRAAVALCKLEGVSRRDAAARRGVPEGTGKGWSMPADWLTLGWTADGKRVIVGKHSSTRGTHVETVLLDPETGKTEPLDLPAGAWVLDAARDGKTFLVAAPGEKQLKLGLAEAGDLAVRELAEVGHSSPGSVTGRLSPDGTRESFAGPDPARKNAFKWGMSQRPYLLDVKTKKVQPLAGFPEDGWLWGVAWSPDGKRVAYTSQQLHEEVLKLDRITVADTRIETEATLVVADADGKNARKVASGKSKYAMNVILAAIDWR